MDIAKEDIILDDLNISSDFNIAHRLRRDEYILAPDRASSSHNLQVVASVE